MTKYGPPIYSPKSGPPIFPKSAAQEEFVEALRENSCVFGTGPAGTGKTFLAVAMGLCRLENNDVQKIVLARPAVEAGESLGFLPGTLEEKISPYMRPVYDALFLLLGPDKTQRLMEQDVIEIAPLAYMRGRTLSNAFVILDEAQNVTVEQMKMFLTRIGKDSWAAITGDPDQVDLPRGTKSGLVDAMKVLEDVDGIELCKFTAQDVMRHELVQKIILAYEKRDKQGPVNTGGGETIR